jgi:tryptophan 2,3-dioxygenase
MNHAGIVSSVDTDSGIESGDTGRNPFTEYLAGDVLLSLQRPRTGAATEPAFLIMGQVMELLFKLVHAEVSRARDLLEGGDVPEALWTLRRLHREHTFLNSGWDVLSALSPTEYDEFRGKLGDASGFQSVMYRHLEFVLGNKVAAVVHAHSGDREAHAALQRALAEPSLYDTALRLLSRRGVAVPAACVERDWTRPYREQDAVVDAWRSVYAGRARHRDLYELAEALMDLAYDQSRWRQTHVLTVERLLGGKAGTGGTAGAGWLRRVAEHRFCPELWTVRTQL